MSYELSSGHVCLLKHQTTGPLSDLASQTYMYARDKLINLSQNQLR